MKEILRVEHLSKHYTLYGGLFAALKDRQSNVIKAVDDISFSVREKEILGFVGESGCGKSTMSRSVLMLIRPTAGSVYYDGVDLRQLHGKKLKTMRRHVQMIFQDPHGSLNPRRTVSEILRQSVRIHRLARKLQEENALIRKTLAEVELDPDRFWDRYPILLSGGQRQRVGIARVLILQPKLIIADEPISMLDVSVRIGVLDLLQKMREKNGIAFIYITHDLATARYICDRIAIMYLGKIVEIAPTEEILAHPLHPYTKALIAAVPVTDPTVRVENVPIRGYVPSKPDEVGVGCRFHPRCLYTQEQCLELEPQLAQVGPDHWVTCRGGPARGSSEPRVGRKPVG
jgi:peptide/nickel transport system ATP-binding protein